MTGRPDASRGVLLIAFESLSLLCRSTYIFVNKLYTFLLNPLVCLPIRVTVLSQTVTPDFMKIKANVAVDVNIVID